MQENDFIEMGYRDVKLFGGQLSGIYRFIFTYGICIGLDSTGYKKRFCFDTYSNAKLFLDEWDGVSLPEIGLDGSTAIK